MTIAIVLLCILALVMLITIMKVNPFLAFLIVSLLAGILLGIPIIKISKSVEKGIGDMLGSTTIIICLGAMLGKLIAESGAAQRIASVMMRAFGTRYIQWALVFTGFIIGIPLFYGTGFVLMVPLIFSVVYKYKLPAVVIGLSMLTALSVTHGFLPPHPSPSALVVLFDANMGKTLLYGLVIAIPAIIIGGPLFCTTLKNIKSQPLKTFIPEDLPEEKLPGTFNSFFSALLPVLLLMFTTLLPFIWHNDHAFSHLITFFSEPGIVMLIALVVATFTLGIRQGKSMNKVMNIYGDAVKDIAMVLLIIGGSGALKQVLTDSGVSDQIGAMLQNLNLQPLLLGWLIAAIIRVCIGSATVAGLTAAGIIAPLLVSTNANPNLMVLSIGAGSLMFSHVNDSGFWLFKEYFNISVKDTFKSWSMMETIVSVVGLIGVLLLNIIV
jgi:Gnt-I system high-affinity gluconate transporter